MSVYLDASFLVSFYTADAFSARASAYLSSNKPVVVISDFAAAEFASAIARRVRMSELTMGEGRSALSTFDASAAQSSQRVYLDRADIAAADAYLRRLNLKLRTPDALNIAIAHRISAKLVTFDQGMVAAAQNLGVTTVVP